MKPKITKEKLTLKKQTISNLSNVELNGLKGGTADSDSGCTICIACFVLSRPMCIDPSVVTQCNTTP